jgi:hypothetical protein
MKLLIYPLITVIFHSCVSLSEGNRKWGTRWSCELTFPSTWWRKIYDDQMFIESVAILGTEIGGTYHL